MSWDSFKNLAQSKIISNKTWQQAKESLVIEYANRLLIESFGDKTEHKAQAVYFKDQILTIAVLSDRMLGELELGKHQFLTAINDHFHKNIVKDLQFLS
jgi:hypothetical protein